MPPASVSVAKSPTSPRYSPVSSLPNGRWVCPAWIVTTPLAASFVSERSNYLPSRAQAVQPDNVGQSSCRIRGQTPAAGQGPGKSGPWWLPVPAALVNCWPYAPQTRTGDRCCGCSLPEGRAGPRPVAGSAYRSPSVFPSNGRRFIQMASQLRPRWRTGGTISCVPVDRVGGVNQCSSKLQRTTPLPMGSRS